MYLENKSVEVLGQPQVDETSMANFNGDAVDHNGDSFLQDGNSSFQNGEVPLQNGLSASQVTQAPDLDTSHAIPIDGESLSIELLAAVSRQRTPVRHRNVEQVTARTNASVEGLHRLLATGEPIYGVNTGFGGSANTRTPDYVNLQRGLLQMQQCGILVHSGRTKSSSGTPSSDLAFTDSLENTVMPETWVRGAMLVRINSLVRGHSAVRLEIIEKLMAFLNHDYIPLVPLKGSISASGDLSPLSYIAGVLEGNPDLFVYHGPANESGHRAIMSSDKAIKQLGLNPIVFGPKEGLGVMNGTAVSCTVGALASHDADHLSIMVQVLTAMSVESIGGASRSFSHFLSAIRDHDGQKEVASNIRRFLRGTRLGQSGRSCTRGQKLAQDRYAFRTAPQWLGPQVEDLSLARKQITTELNSTTDNPVFEVTGETCQVYNGGNFQAMSVTSAMEKVRGALQLYGKLIFDQCTQMVNSDFNNGLPPNLAADEPSVSYTMKGLDITAAAYLSELGFLSNTVRTHVQNAEMSNQSVNSLALISARYTHKAVEQLSSLCAVHIYLSCQALDLRVMHLGFLHKLEMELRNLTYTYFAPYMKQSACFDLVEDVWIDFQTHLGKTVCMDSQDRFVSVFVSVSAVVYAHIQKLTQINTGGLDENTTLDERPATADLLKAFQSVGEWKEKASSLSASIFCSNRASYLRTPDATPYLGVASKKMYTFIRQDLGVPMHRGLAGHPVSIPEENAGVTHTNEILSRDFQEAQCNGSMNHDPGVTTGAHLSIIVEALSQGRLQMVGRECMQEPEDNY